MRATVTRVDVPGLFHPGPDKVPVLDPTLKGLGCLWVPLEQLEYSAAMLTCVGPDPQAGTLCIQHQKGRCRSEQECALVHVERDYLHAMRAVLASLPLSNCCFTHGDLPSSRPDMHAFRQRRAVEIFDDDALPIYISPLLIAVTAYWDAQKALLPLNQPLRVRAKRICRLHQDDRCKLKSSCGNVHVCRHFWRLREQLIGALTGDTTRPLTYFVTPPVEGEEELAVVSGALAQLQALLLPPLPAPGLPLDFAQFGGQPFGASVSQHFLTIPSPSYYSFFQAAASPQQPSYFDSAGMLQHMTGTPLTPLAGSWGPYASPASSFVRQGSAGSSLHRASSFTKPNPQAVPPRQGKSKGRRQQSLRNMVHAEPPGSSGVRDPTARHRSLPSGSSDDQVHVVPDLLPARRARPLQRMLDGVAECAASCTASQPSFSGSDSFGPDAGSVVDSAPRSPPHLKFEFMVPWLPEDALNRATSLTQDPEPPEVPCSPLVTEPRTAPELIMETCRPGPAQEDCVSETGSVYRVRAFSLNEDLVKEDRMLLTGLGGSEDPARLRRAASF